MGGVLLKKGIKRAGFCFLLAAVVSLTANLTKTHNQVFFDPEIVKESFYHGLSAMRDKEAAGEYLEDTFHKLQELIDRCQKLTSQQARENCYPGLFNG